MTEHYLDMTELGRALASPVSRHAVSKWRERYPEGADHPFPAPSVTVGGVPGWSRQRLPEIEAWRARLPGRTGRPPTAGRTSMRRTPTGAILEATPAMGPWHVVLGQGSFYLSPDSVYPHTSASEPKPRPVLLMRADGGIAVPVEEVAHVSAALDQMCADGHYQTWRTSGNTEDQGVWGEPIEHDTFVYFDGPVLDPGIGEDQAVSNIGLEFRYIADLRDRLAGFTSTAQPE